MPLAAAQDNLFPYRNLAHFSSQVKKDRDHVDTTFRYVRAPTTHPQQGFHAALPANPSTPLLALLTTTQVYSANFQYGLDAANRGNYVTALEQWPPLAEQGNADAQFSLGGMYYKGFGVTLGVGRPRHLPIPAARQRRS